MSTGKHNQHKQHKMGQLPGDWTLHNKIALLERSPIQLEERLNRSTKRTYWPFEPKQAKVFKRDHIKRANRAFRHQKIRNDEE